MMPSQGHQVLLTTTAWHEAGHALAALREGWSIQSVEIHRGRPGNGLMRSESVWPAIHYHPSRSHGNARAVWVEEVNRHLSRLRVILAGPLAEAKKLAKPMRALGGWYDFEEAYWLAQSLMLVQRDLREEGIYLYCGPDVPAIFNAESRRVRHWIGRPATWSAISSIAEKLLAHGKLGAREIMRCYLESRNARQLPLALDWATDPELRD